ncbi:hypothetical protein HHK36_014202 [Tetracentron sinense]|uniref:Leucine-rich repeat-containing N-terminal plant-type domain-containing protein n=1 Tax=Tetracentron sinense TaxID=13715 RepID=A0A834Z3J9_TETSI|nr:hypothetical protein HHK36_014202 [Tetracentron sinense]
MNSQNKYMKMMGSCSILTHLLFLLLLLLGCLHLETIKPTLGNEDLKVGCGEKDRKALLEFKEGLNDSSGWLSSWVGEDCCSWRGVGCIKKTGRVIKLDLRNSFCVYQLIYPKEGGYRKVPSRSCLSGKINPSLFHLKHLNYLDLSMINFGGISIPEFMGSLKNLKYLNLSNACFTGKIPPHLGNLSRLNYLDLQDQSYVCELEAGIYADNLKWLSGLSSLKYLDMTVVNLGMVGADWLKDFNMLLPSLSELHLINCRLDSPPLSLPFVNFSLLSVLDLSDNFFGSSMPLWLFNISSLANLHLSNNYLRGSIPDAFADMTSLQELDLSSNDEMGGEIPRTLGTLCNLKRLDLSVNRITGEITKFLDRLSGCTNSSLEMLHLDDNQLSGHLPNSLGNLKKLRSLGLSKNQMNGTIPESVGQLSELFMLDLSNNQMNGTIPESVGQLSELVMLDLSYNSWEGVISEVHFLNLTRLEEMDISSTRLEEMDVSLISPTKSLVFNTRNEWIPPFSTLKSIKMDNVQMGPSFPAWLQTQKELNSISLSNVGILETVPDWFWKLPDIEYLDLSNNRIRGRLPNSMNFNDASEFILSSNLFSGPIPVNIGEIMPRLIVLDLSRNILNGSIPYSIGKMKDLINLFLSDNQFSGELPGFWKGLQQLSHLAIANNNLTGNIPSSMGFLHSLTLLLLNNNSLDGELPSSLQNCTQLFTIDLGENRFSGKVPKWIGENSFSLRVLSLRSNLFSGNIPLHLCHLFELRILDLANNNLSGFIPHCLGNLATLVHRVGGTALTENDLIHVVAKGKYLEYRGGRVILVKSIDLSSNNLTGEIPEEITGLLELGTLNLSFNSLTGKIPEKIGNLKMLETLDLSRNQLSGSIPQSLSSLNFLSYLNLSHNNLWGEIPSGYQLQTLNDPSIYEGNQALCGPPLVAKCSRDEASQGPSSIGGDGEGRDDEDGFEMLWFCTSMALGFVGGFWGVCGTLLIKKTWRHAYFRFFDNMKDGLFMIAAVNVARLKRKMDLE